MDTNNIATIVGFKRPEIDYTPGTNGRLEKEQYTLAGGYVRSLLQSIKEIKSAERHNQDHAKLECTQTELFGFLDTLPHEDKMEAFSTIGEDPGFYCL